MGTNYYRLPKVDEIESRYAKFLVRMKELDRWDPSMIERGYRYIQSKDNDWDTINPWEEMMDGMNLHLGKRNMGWKFCWNFHNNKFYTNKEELLDFIRKGRIFDEYGSEEPVEEFIKMALEWGQPDGMVANKEYFDNYERLSQFNKESYYDKEIDGLRVSSTTEFC